MVEYARLPAKTYENDDMDGERVAIIYLETRGFFDGVLRKRRHAIFSDKGGWGVRHYEQSGLLRFCDLMNLC